MAKENKDIESAGEPLGVSEKIEAPKNIQVSDEIVDSQLYNAEVIARFGKTSIGEKIEKKGSVIRVLLAKKLVKLI